ncbi:MAG: DUF5686 family protein [Saprospiraceae bacterium]
MRSILWAIIALVSSIPSSEIFSQKTTFTIVKGKVTDAETKEGLAFVSVAAPGFAAGTRTDENGFYLLRTEQKITKIQFNYLGYKTVLLPVKTGEEQTLDVKMEPSAQQLEEVTIKAKKYKRKDNPVVDLIELVIAHRDQNHVADLATYQDEQYEKIFLGLSNLSKNLKTSRLLRPIRFVFENIDTSKLGGLPVTPIFLQENVMDYYSQSDPKRWKKYIKASKSVRFGEMVDDDGMDKGLQYLYQEVDIYNNYVDMLSDQFMSPIANNAPLFYRYYAADTIEEAGKKIVRLEFYPKNKLDMLLQGDLYIALDSSFAVTRINFSVNPNINLNWVKELVVEQDFQLLPSGKWVMSTEDYRMHFGLNKHGAGMVAQRFVTHRHPFINPVLPDSVLRDKVSEIVTLPTAKVVDNDYWETARPIPLNTAEAATYTNLDSLRKTRFYKVSTKIAYALFGAYADVGMFQIGPMSSFYTFNGVEGTKLLFGGRTGPKLSKRWRIEGWAGYGFRDLRWKYSIGGAYGLKGTEFNKFPNCLLRVNYLYDVLLPVQNFQASQSASFANSVVRGANDKFFYYNRFNAQYEREYQNHFSIIIGGENRQFRPAGALFFELAEGGAVVQDPVIASNGFVQLRYSPGETFYQGGTSRAIVDFNYTVSLRYSKGFKGIAGGEYNYHELVGSLNKFTNTPPFGYNKCYVEAGSVFGKVPFPLLTIHRGNQTYITQPFSYNLMNFMEFVSDRYATLMVEQYFAGFFLNKIPLLRRLKLRETCSFKILYGQVSAKNRPTENSGLLKFPAFPDGTPITYTLEDKPYIEASVGITNIFKIFRVDLIRRFTYLEHPGAAKYGIRFGVWVEF